MSTGSPVLSGYYGVRRSFLPESDIHTSKQYSNDLYSPSLGSKPCDLTSIQSYPPLLDPYYAESIGDYRGPSITSGSSSLFGAPSLPPLIPHFSGDPSHYLLRDSWEQTVPDTINQLDVLCSDVPQTVSSSSCLSPETGGVHYRSSSRGSVAQGTQPYSLHALDDVHYSSSFPAPAPYGFSPFMTVANELTPKMSHHLSPDDTTETNSLHDNSSWPKDDPSTAWSPYELRRNY
uniref:POU class 2 homeobox associating factor 2 n=1 Tax=Leptobrachium leishanense TaxID=445787 RepID=A0A8C5PCS5_9ANUR